MDSLTQITLGAAVGEAVLGKKVGNRALLWGAIGGTIPDLDVLANFMMSEVDALAFHRGISHSILFSIIGGWLMGIIVHWFYKSKHYHLFAFSGWISFLTGIFLLSGVIIHKQKLHWITFGLGTLLFIYLIFQTSKKYFVEGRNIPNASVRDWQWLFFASILTHPILDCFTTYGTQLFQPFSDLRVSFSSISVADPIYTVPFLLCVIGCSFYNRTNALRSKLNWIGVGVSSAYLLFTLVNKIMVTHKFEESLVSQRIEYDRIMTSPTILNNILWSAIAQKDDKYYISTYSYFDSQPINFAKVERNENLLDDNNSDRTIKILKWFTNDYYNVIIRKDGKPQINDLRFGTFNNDYLGEESYIFRFPLEKDENGKYELVNGDGGPPKGKEQEVMKNLIVRIKGN